MLKVEVAAGGPGIFGVHMQIGMKFHGVHPRVPRPMNVQSAGKDAKPYQVRQLRDIVEEFGLRLEE
jgi:hypothetical protein